jgi:predicted transcriptional regulator
MKAININQTTQRYIAEMYNKGVVPQIEEEPTYYIVVNDGPNLIVDRHEYVRVWKDKVDVDIIAVD